MTNWIPLLASDRPRYLAIADAIAQDLATGKLKIGDRLPPQRELAFRLGVTVGTITRAYQEAERRGLLSGEVGRGSYLRDPQRRSILSHSLAPEPGVLQMHIAAPPRVHSLKDLDSALDQVKTNAARQELLDYGPSAGAAAYRQMGAAWLERSGVIVSPEEVVVTAGAHPALIACLSLLARRNGHVVTEPLSYPTILPICRLLGLHLHAADMDENGIVPQSLEALVKACGAQLIYLVPTLHNPTTITTSEESRQAVAELAKRLDLTVIEDDIFRLLSPKPVPPSIFQLAPERTFYITSLSKSVAPGLRVGFVATPKGRAEGVALQQMIIGARVAGLTAEVARLWIGNGTAERTLADIRNEIAMRRLIALSVLGHRKPLCAEGSIFLWLPLPEQWRPGDFVRAAETRGVKVTPGSAFAVARRQGDQAVRVCFGIPESREALRGGFEMIERLLEEEPPESFRVLA
jgi:DNA-binding transcriptional MocR family regulator